MKVLLTRAARIWHHAGEIVEVSPAEAGFLFSTGSAVRAPETKAEAEVPEMPEESAASAETPEKAAAKKTTKKKSTK